MPKLYLILIKNNNNDPKKNNENTIDVQWEIKIRIRQKNEKNRKTKFNKIINSKYKTKDRMSLSQFKSQL